MNKKIVVWFNPNTNTYYYKHIYDTFNRYHVGYVNQYSHKVIIVIDIYKDLFDKPSIKVKVIKRLIRFLQKSIDERS